ncbi:MAG: 4'-phosphopantetheinyl transferase superfamily protein [Bacteroidota bacterium]|nr:4'-phosphopantetheinyl transferase superfamily protein [Bacteroidota bacterium]
MSFVKSYASPAYSWGLWKIDTNLTSDKTRAEIRKIQSNEAKNALRLLLNKEQIHLSKDSFGKPYLLDENCGIGISHSNNWVAVMKSKSKKVGIDVQLFSTKILGIVAKFASEKEQTVPRNFNDLHWFTLLWAAKESVYKWHSKGGVNFREQIKISMNSVKPQFLNAELKVSGDEKQLTLAYFFFEQGVLCFVK